MVIQLQSWINRDLDYFISCVFYAVVATGFLCLVGLLLKEDYEISIEDCRKMRRTKVRK